MFFALAFSLAAGGAAQAETLEQQKDVLLSVAGGVTRWAAVYQLQPQRSDDPYLHVRVLEHRKGAAPWDYKELVFHMAVTPEALAASRVDGKAKTFNYKDVEIRAEYRRWLENGSTRAKTPVCDTNILDCIRALPK
jgi:hypothetical protein